MFAVSLASFMMKSTVSHYIININLALYCSTQVSNKKNKIFWYNLQPWWDIGYEDVNPHFTDTGFDAYAT